ncbi:hypothetical protein ARMGADRAFT_148811 [Armillaria gallica]|uniref:Uncharacterized protein n=1 Tax=Armillaria gallica TaxID=47427 RepID=A0A2H3DD19_ARMGA|nr:hypothetical protein ARMGADRAFT_148811 [Armillaria gallica]
MVVSLAEQSAVAVVATSMSTTVTNMPFICYHEMRSCIRSSRSLRGTLVDEIIGWPAKYASTDFDTRFFRESSFLNILHLLSLAVHYDSCQWHRPQYSDPQNWKAPPPGTITFPAPVEVVRVDNRFHCWQAEASCSPEIFLILELPPGIILLVVVLTPETARSRMNR